MKLNKTLVTLIALFFILSAVKIFSQSLLNENSIKFESVTTATLVGQDGLILRTEDGGLNWTEQTSGITNVLNSNDYVNYTDDNGEDTKLQVAVGENGVILRSFDDGTTWEVMNSGTTEHLNDVTIYSPNTILVCGNNGTLLRSADYGSTWTAVTINTTSNLNEIASIGPSLTEVRISSVVVGNGGTIFVSTDNNEWFEIASGTTENLLTAAFMGNNVICAGDNGTILKSVDNGAIWVAATSGVTTKIFDVKFVSANVIVGTSENGTIVRSEDLGETWSTILTPSEVDLYAVNFGNESFGISIGSESTELYTTDGGVTWIGSIEPPAASKNMNEQVKLSQNFPNPFNPSTVISYNVNDNANVSIKVYDMTGREVRTLVNTFQNAGTYSVNFNASNLASGIYFYVLRVNSGSMDITKTMKMILTK
ncbi:MAG TPA: T9SS type A sorting domain-containing protein [Ignavibacteria bacterium]|nr:T9SS type A sorting domain-containing protein [Ignavibacteria bacterium]